MNYVKMFHVLFMIVWVGQLLSLTRLMGYGKLHEMRSIYRRMYLFVDLPSMVITVLLGIILLSQKMTLFKMPYFHLKLTLAALLIGADLYLGKSILSKKEQNPIKFKILHGVCGLLLIGILFAIYVFKVIAN